MGFDVFISHSSKDKAVADAACATLEAAGTRCWIAPRDIVPGTEYGAAIIDALDHCRVVVLIFSSNANESPQLRREVERAVSRGVPIVPVRIENVLPTKSMAYFVESVHWLDALTPPMESHLQRLAEAVKAILQVAPAGVATEIKSGPAAVAAVREARASTPAAQVPPISEGQQARRRAPASDQQRPAGSSRVTKIALAATALLACIALGIYGYRSWKPVTPVPPSVAKIDTLPSAKPSEAVTSPPQPQQAAPAQLPNVAVQPPAAPAATTAAPRQSTAVAPNVSTMPRNQNPVDGGMPVNIGDTYEMISAAYQTYQRPSPSPWDQKNETWLYLKDQGIEFFFDSSAKIYAIHFVAPWTGSIRGAKLDDTSDRVKSLAGQPMASEERFGGDTLALIYRWPYTLTVEFHVDRVSNKVKLIILD